MSEEPGSPASPDAPQARGADARGRREAVWRDRSFVVLLTAVTIAFALILWPFFGAVFWAAVLAILFAPVNRRMRARMPRRPGLAALATLGIILVIVILPAALVTALLTQEAMGIVQRVQSGDIQPGRILQRLMDAMPDWITAWLGKAGLTSLADVRERFSAGITRGLQYVGTQALSVGQNTFEFIVNFFLMLYLLFFLLRDGAVLGAQIGAALPLQPALQRDLAVKFVQVIRATIKGSVVIAIVQGALGTLIFWLLGIDAAILWGVVMALLSLLPAVGTALVWVPAAVYLLGTGALWQGLALVAFGALVIGSVDNLLRPILVGKDTKMPDYLVLLSTLGGLAVFGFNGFVIGPIIAAMFIATWHQAAASRGAT